MNYEQLRSQWQPAPGSKLAMALGRAEEAAAQWAAVLARIVAAESERALVQQRLDAVHLGSDVQSVVDDIGRAAALDLVIMRGQLELNRLRVVVADAASDVEGHISELGAADKNVNEATRRWGADSSDATHAKRIRQARHMHLLATPESSPAM